MLEFEIVMNEFEAKSYSVLRIKTYSGNLLSISLI